ncbi:peptidylprolyl isomerase [Carboxylicivirga sp. A043]|uniref:peptidylprolyl isomerase n=1 Tax=Carboxylicivirga litoralis TaxID=2816963 RepID=UPI0021CB0DCE|nr:peptidylprolyl isomerase [Carboxylicivirga sp. A043]MCU4155085.1 peptidylprolyl isomerase [Carboxylicivirga sp. A043]
MKNILLALFVLLIMGCSSNPRVEIKTSEGLIMVELFEKNAPITVSNFLQLVDEKQYDGSVFYRVVTLTNQEHNSVKIEVIQGGLFHDDLVEALKPISHETTDKTNVRHIDGTISMARLEPGTASSEFFICIGEQPELDYGGKRNPDGQGFAAFGRVVKGMDVVKRIHTLENTNQLLDAKVKIESISRI